MMDNLIAIFDENDTVEVVLTKAGASIINDYNRWLDSLTTDVSNRELFKTDYKESDLFHGELWVVMKIFYGELNKGTEKCFKEIRLFETKI